MTLAWYCARTVAHREDRAREGLEALGLVVYLPLETVNLHRSRGKDRRVVETIRPLIPRHLFIGVEPQGAPWRAIKETDGVERLLSAERNGAPSQVPWRAIAIVQTVEGELRDDFERRKAKTRTKRGPKPDEVIAALKAAEPDERASILWSYVEKGHGVKLKLGDLKAVVEGRVATF
jgi:transcription antitermination factor NusG